MVSKGDNLPGRAFEMIACLRDQRFRRAFRLCCFLVLVVVLHVIYMALNLEYIRLLSPTRAYSEDSLTVEVTSCDVLVKAGAKREIVVEGALRSVVEKITFSSMDTVQFLSATSSADCRDQPRMDCHRLCQVTITVPSDSPPEQLWVYQSTSDTANHVRVVIEHVVLNRLYIRGSGGNYWDKAGPTLELDMLDVQTTGALYVSLDSGHVSLQGCQLESTVDIRSVNSVTLIDMPETGPLSLKWRQPNNRLCVTGLEGQLALPDPAGNFGLCSSQYYKTTFSNYYDTSKDFFLDQAEFGAQLNKVPYCCGGSCPHASYCNGILDQIFPFEASGTSDASYSSRSKILTASATWTNIEALGYSGMVPLCFRELQLTSPLVHNRTLVGWPEGTVGTVSTTPSGAAVAVACLRHSDCITNYCNATSALCAANPAISYGFVYAWSSCDKVCGGGQRVRSGTCVGSDGFKYPQVLCTGLHVAPLVENCNTQACVLPQSAPVFAIGSDLDLRSGYISIDASVQVPVGASKVRVLLGTGDAMLSDQAWEASSSDCTNCTIRVESSLTSYVDRLYAVGASADGDGPSTSILLTDRIGDTVSKSWKLGSEASAVRVHLRAASGCLWKPEDQLTGLRMYLPDARKLMSEVGPKFGDPESSDHGIVIIDTVPAPGIPTTRWIYSTRPVFLAVDPSYLTLFSAGLVAPSMDFYRIRLNDLSCAGAVTTGGAWDFTNVASEAKLGQMWKQIAKALRSDGWASAQTLRGTLVLLQPGTEKIGLSHDRPELWEFEEIDDDNITMRVFDVGQLKQIMDSSVVLSVVVGILFGIAATFTLYTLAAKQLQVHMQHQRQKHAVLAAKLGDKFKDRGGGEEDDDENRPVGFNPFRQPLVLINVLVVRPIRRRLVNSLRRFTKEMVDIMESHPPASAALSPAAMLPPSTDHDPENKDLEAAKVQRGKPAWEGKHEAQAVRFTYMREFRMRYEEFCIDEDLNPIHNRNEIVRSLVAWYNLRVVQETVWRMKGVVWNPPMLPKGVESPPPPVVPAPVEWLNSGGLEADEAAGPGPLTIFCNERMCVTRKSRQHWVDIRNRRLPTGKTVQGLYQRYLAYCQQNDIDAPSIKEMDPNLLEGPLQAFAGANGVTFQELSVQRIPNVILRPSKAHVIEWSVLGMDILTVLCHLCFMLAPGALMINYVLMSQMVFARSMALGDPLVYQDILGSFLPYMSYGTSNKEILMITRIVGVWQITYFVLALLRVFIHYTGIEGSGKWAFDIFFAVVLLLEIAGVVSWAGMVAAWGILVAILDPLKYLSYGTAILVVIAVVITIWNEMHAAADSVRKKVTVAVKKKMQEILQGIKQSVEAKMHEQAVTALGLRKRIDTSVGKKAPVKVDDSEAGFKEYHDANKGKEVTLTDIFQLLDTDQSGVLQRSEFKELFTSMGDKMPPQVIDQLFAYCDADGSGTITETELEEGWAYVSHKIVEERMAEFGTSWVDILIAIIYAVVTLCVLFAFIFLALQGWSSETSFTSIVQTALVSGCGRIVTGVRKRAPAEKPDVDDIMEEMDASAEDGDGGEGDGGDGGG